MARGNTRGTVLVVLLASAALGRGGSPESLPAAVLDAASMLRAGLVVDVGLRDRNLFLKVVSCEGLLVHGLCEDPQQVKRLREELSAKGLWGRATVELWRSAPQLPYRDNLVNVIVVCTAGAVSREEVLRVLAPYGTAIINEGGTVKKVVKPYPNCMDQWGHFLHGPDNNAVGKDRTVAAPRGIQWVAEPKWTRSHEELASLAGAVTAGGRLFYILDEGPLFSIRLPSQWRLIARDAFNGLLLWKRDIPLWIDRRRHFRSGPVHVQRRLVAEGDRVYVTLGLGAPVSVLDARTGRTLRILPLSESAEEIVVSGGTVWCVVGTSEVKRRGPGLAMEGEPAPTPFRFIGAWDAESGTLLWKKDFSGGPFLLPLSLTVYQGNVYYKTTQYVGCLDAQKGTEKWRAPATTPKRRMAFSAPTMVASDGVLLCADREGQGSEAASEKDVIEWGVSGWGVQGIPRRAKTVLRAYDAARGNELWSCPCTEGYNSPVDVFVVGGVVYAGTSYQGRDLRTGRIVKTLPTQGAPVGMLHHRCYRNKATEKYMFTSRSGVELISFEKGWLCNNSWIRGTCQYGIMPANGLLYAPPDSCACFHLVKVLGVFAAVTAEGGLPMPQSAPGTLEKGPAWGTGRGPEAHAEDWPLYRHDPERSGAAPTSVKPPLSVLWRSKLGGALTQPTVVGTTVFIAQKEACTLLALSAERGEVLWRFPAGGRIDSPPAYWRGRVIFGCGDGCVYCLRASDGELVWRFRAAPVQRKVLAFGRLESVWPGPGAVLVQNGSLYVLAGRSTYLDGGLLLYRLDPSTGTVQARRTLYDLDPRTGTQLHGENPRKRPFDMAGTRADVLVGDGDSVFLRRLRFSADLTPRNEPKPHLLSISDFLTPEWFVRAYWLLGTDVGAGWGGWNFMGNLVPAGRLLVFNSDRVFGYGRKEYLGGPAGHRGDLYHLFGMERKVAPISAERGARRKVRRRKKTYLWSLTEAPLVRAMVLAGNTLCVAGVPNVGVRDPKQLRFRNEKEVLEALEGKRGIFLQLRSGSDGALLAQYKLPREPVWDGLVAARGRLFCALSGGELICLAGK